MREFHLISCERCGLALYQTDGENIRSPNGVLLPIHPVYFTVANHRVLCCSSECASKWFYSKTTEELISGYPLF